jgi:hypothetical protein
VNPSGEIKVYLETGKKRTIAGAVDWPGWCRVAQDETGSLNVLLKYGIRYAEVLHAARIDFQAPRDLAAFRVIERISGNATTDYGTPGLPPSSDSRPVSQSELHFLQNILVACWQRFDITALAAQGKQLRTGPRGGGRDLEAIIHHTQEAELHYLERLGMKATFEGSIELEENKIQNRQRVLEALASSARGEIPAKGPRGGLRWTPRYFVRRAAWHVLDHAWEIEDRIL